MEAPDFSPGTEESNDVGLQPQCSRFGHRQRQLWRGYLFRNWLRLPARPANATYAASRVM